jgi:hypothetical protein
MWLVGADARLLLDILTVPTFVVIVVVCCHYIHKTWKGHTN